MEKEGNILVGLSSDVPTPASLASLLLELDIALPADRDATVVDHFNFDTVSAADKHDVLVLPSPAQSRLDVKDYFHVDGVLAVPHAVGQTLANANPLLAPILRAPATAYSYSPSDEADGSSTPFATGSQLSLVTALQARNSARFTVLGSVEMLSDKWFGASVTPAGTKNKAQTANRAFAEKLTAWTFKELGVLKVGRLQHYLKADNNPNWSNDTALSNTQLNPKIYRIKNEAVRIPVSLCVLTRS